MFTRDGFSFTVENGAGVQVLVSVMRSAFGWLMRADDDTDEIQIFYADSGGSWIIGSDGTLDVQLQESSVKIPRGAPEAEQWLRREIGQQAAARKRYPAPPWVDDADSGAAMREVMGSELPEAPAAPQAAPEAPAAPQAAPEAPAAPQAAPEAPAAPQAAPEAPAAPQAAPEAPAAPQAALEAPAAPQAAPEAPAAPQAAPEAPAAPQAALEAPAARKRWFVRAPAPALPVADIGPGAAMREVMGSELPEAHAASQAPVHASDGECRAAAPMPRAPAPPNGEVMRIGTIYDRAALPIIDIDPVYPLPPPPAIEVRAELRYREADRVHRISVGDVVKSATGRIGIVEARLEGRTDVIAVRVRSDYSTLRVSMHVEVWRVEVVDLVLKWDAFIG